MLTLPALLDVSRTGSDDWVDLQCLPRLPETHSGPAKPQQVRSNRRKSKRADHPTKKLLTKKAKRNVLYVRKHVAFVVMCRTPRALRSKTNRFFCKKTMVCWDDRGIMRSGKTKERFPERNRSRTPQLHQARTPQDHRLNYPVCTTRYDLQFSDAFAVLQHPSFFIQNYAHA